jgi:hypothetical protein
MCEGPAFEATCVNTCSLQPLDRHPATESARPLSNRAARSTLATPAASVHILRICAFSRRILHAQPS